MQKEETHYLITFRDPDQKGQDKPANINLKVRKITDSSLGLAFMAMSGFIFDQKGPIVDPNEEKLRKRYENTRSLHLSIYNIVSIEEVGVENRGLHFDHDKSKLLVLPSPSSHPVH